MIRNHSEQDMHEFISKSHTCHDTIKFTFNYSDQEATFLDVNMNGEIDTCVHEKVKNCHPESFVRGGPSLIAFFVFFFS